MIRVNVKNPVKAGGRIHDTFSVKHGVCYSHHVLLARRVETNGEQLTTSSWTKQLVVSSLWLNLLPEDGTETILPGRQANKIRLIYCLFFELFPARCSTKSMKQTSFLRKDTPEDHAIIERLY